MYPHEVVIYDINKMDLVFLKIYNYFKIRLNYLIEVFRSSKGITSQDPKALVNFYNTNFSERDKFESNLIFPSKKNKVTFSILVSSQLENLVNYNKNIFNKLKSLKTIVSSSATLEKSAKEIYLPLGITNI